jgi:TatA/E family protein of Tat protein translocase
VLNVGWGEMALIMLIALIVFGPNRLPEIARSMGKFVRNFQRETSRAMADLKEGLEPINIGIFDEPDEGAASDPVVAGAIEPVADTPATPAPRQPAARARKAATRKPAATRTAAKRPAPKRAASAKRPVRRTTGPRKPRRRA